MASRLSLQSTCDFFCCLLAEKELLQNLLDLFSIQLKYVVMMFFFLDLLCTYCVSVNVCEQERKSVCEVCMCVCVHVHGYVEYQRKTRLHTNVSVSKVC